MIQAVLAVMCFCAGEAVDDGSRAQKIQQATGVQGGLMVHVGCGSGRFTATLRINDRFLVHGLDADPKKVQQARQRIQALGCYGNISVDTWSGPRLPYAENVVNLLIVEEAARVSREEMLRVLVPLGVAYVKKEGRWTKTIKPWPDDIDEWTHWLYSASGNAVTRDRVVGPPGRLQWAERPIWSRHHNTVPSLNAAVSAGGRFFAIVDEALPGFDKTLPDRYSLIARDAFNGTLLWRIRIKDWGWAAWLQTMYSNFLMGRHFHPMQIQRRLVAVNDKVYVTLGFNAPVSELDAATGAVLRTFKGTDYTSEILCDKERLVLSVNKAPQKPGYLKEDPPVKKKIMVFDRASGRLLWEAGDYVGVSVRGSSVQRIAQLTIVVGGEGVYLVEEDVVVGLDLKTGAELWRVPRPPRPAKKIIDGYRNDHTNLCTLVYHDDRVLFGQPRPQNRRPPWNTTQESDLLSIDARTGDVTWTKEIGSWEYGTPIGIYVVHGLIWVHAHPTEKYTLLALDPATGQVKRRIKTEATFNAGHHHRCARNKATERFLITTRRGVELTGFDDGAVQVNQWIRGECGYGMMPANGLIYTTPHPCRCFLNEKLNGLVALAPRPKGMALPSSKGGTDRVLRGPAYGKIEATDSGAGDGPVWPTYRHDTARSGVTAAKVPVKLKCAWKTTVGGVLSQPVIAGGTVLVAAVDEHRVCAFGAAQGKPLWSFTAGGRVDTPPTIHRGMALFGARDGCVYALRVSDGALVWRLRVVPEDRRLVAYGQVESAWPVHGSVLVVDNVAYAAAGRSSHLDGGIRVVAIDPLSGAALREQTVSSELATSQKSGGGGALADILVFDGQAVRMRQQQVARVNPGKRPRKRGMHLVATGGFLDDTWFNRIFWSVKGRPLGQMLVFDEEAAYGIRAYKKPGDVNAHFVPGKEGYILFGHDFARPSDPPQPAGAKKKRRNQPLKDRWQRRVPVRVQAMVRAGTTFFVAGTPDIVGAKDPWAAIDGRRGGVLQAVAARDGTQLTSYELEAPPVYDGLAASGTCLYMAAADGTISCWK